MEGLQAMSTKGKKNVKLSDYYFINVRLSQEEIDGLRAIDSPEETYPPSLIFAFAMEGYKSSISRDAEHGSYLATLTDTNSDRPSYQGILTGRGSTPLNAWVSLCYKHLVILREDWGERRTASESSGMFG